MEWKMSRCGDGSLRKDDIGRPTSRSRVAVTEMSKHPERIPSSIEISNESQLGKNGRERMRILIVTPEICDSRVLAADGGYSPCVKAGGLADVSALLLDSLTDAGSEVHVTMPNFRSLLDAGENGHSQLLHLCEDREFCYRRAVYDGDGDANLRASLAFQRDVIQYIIPQFRPHLVHCHDWMTGLVPAAARAMGIRSIFTMHNLHDMRTTLAHIEDRGLDSAGFWQDLYYDYFPNSYESTRDGNAVSMLASGILAADRMNTVSESFLHELAYGLHGAPWQVADAVRGKMAAGHAFGILNSLPDNRFPATDPAISRQYDASCAAEGKAANKAKFQRTLGLEVRPDAPLLFWPSRLDPHQKGCGLLADVMEDFCAAHAGCGAQIAFVADGSDALRMTEIAARKGLAGRVAVKAFSDDLSRLGYAAADFLLMPSSFEPCGLAQMIGLRYGSLPVVHATGGLRDTVVPLNAAENTGNGFVFENHDPNGLRWAMDRAVDFHHLPFEEKNRNLQRIMTAAEAAYRPAAMTNQYIELYQNILTQKSNIL